MAVCDYICLTCNGKIEPRVFSSGKVDVRPRKYCSKKCKDNRRRPGRNRKPRAINCEHCKKTVHREIKGSKDIGKFCSRDCYFSYIAKGRAENLARREEEKERTRIAKLAEKEDARVRKLLTKKIEEEIAALFRIKNYIPKPRFISSECKRCLNTFTYKRIRSGRRRICPTCSEMNIRSARRAQKSKRRSIERGIEADSIDPIKVFESSRWICHLCGRKTKKSLRGTYDSMAPELDHIIPLALGGTHTWGNVACSCRSCNGKKGSTPLGQIGLRI